ncbi:receptor-like protein kinase HSL1-like [Hibiscus syriacus]|uniref:Receptor-like protein kinase HSL1-like n=1 Tax=Hibiscus syriacus TaxID=106335 RepID=A0A6A3BUR6_HIBSY|nr:receptor-like protein kinase HSL1-like [Hibiscus syriacus]
MENLNPYHRTKTIWHHHGAHCTKTHQVGALLLIVSTLFFTRLLDHLPSGIDNNGSQWLMWTLIFATLANGALRLLLKSRFRTREKDEADFFFVTAYVKCVHMLEEAMDGFQALRQMPYFRRSGGRDHIFVFPSGNGAHFFTSWKTFLNRSIFLTPEGGRKNNKNTSTFDTWKDIIIPGNVNDEMTTNGGALVHPLPLSNRKYLANYLGRAQGLKDRLQLIQLANQYPYKLEAPDLKHDPPDKLFKVEYFEHLRNAKFCLIPRGLSSWTLRFYESFFVECVPVILSDRIELPFQNVIDYTRFTIKWPAKRINPQLLEYLESIPDEVIEGMIANGRQIKCLWTYAPESEPCSAMHGILWELQRKVRVFHQSAETFWLHNGTIVNRDLVEFRGNLPCLCLESNYVFSITQATLLDVSALDFVGSDPLYIKLGRDEYNFRR